VIKNLIKSKRNSSFTINLNQIKIEWFSLLRRTRLRNEKVLIIKKKKIENNISKYQVQKKTNGIFESLMSDQWFITFDIWKHYFSTQIAETYIQKGVDFEQRKELINKRKETHLKLNWNLIKKILTISNN
jgi:hypothetical protein